MTSGRNWRPLLSSIFLHVVFGSARGFFRWPVSAPKNPVPTDSPVNTDWMSVATDWVAAESGLRQTEPLILSRPFERRITQVSDADAAGKATFNRGFDETRGDEGH